MLLWVEYIGWEYHPIYSSVSFLLVVNAWVNKIENEIMLFSIDGETKRVEVYHPKSIQKNTKLVIHSYLEATGLVGMGLRLIPVIVKGKWPFDKPKKPGSMSGKWRRFLMTKEDGTGNDDIYNNIVKHLPTPPPTHYEEIIISFIPEQMLEECSKKDSSEIGMLSACFDVASWFLDTLPIPSDPHILKINRRRLRAITLGVYARLLISRLWQVGAISNEMYIKLSDAISGITIEKIAMHWYAENAATSNKKSSEINDIVNQYLKAFPGKLSDLLRALDSVDLSDKIIDTNDSDEMFSKAINKAIPIIFREK